MWPPTREQPRVSYPSGGVRKSMPKKDFQFLYLRWGKKVELDHFQVHSILSPVECDPAQPERP